MPSTRPKEYLSGFSTSTSASFVSLRASASLTPAPISTSLIYYGQYKDKQSRHCVASSPSSSSHFFCYDFDDHHVLYQPSPTHLPRHLALRERRARFVRSFTCPFDNIFTDSIFSLPKRDAPTRVLLARGANYTLYGLPGGRYQNATYSPVTVIVGQSYPS